jgi:serine/threonine-protein kinase
LAGQRIGAYKLRTLIGQGGMGGVWLGERADGRFEGVAAIKLLNVSLVGRIGERRFRREGSILARLRHPNVAHLIDAGVSPVGQPYLVLEYVAGEPIDRYCDARRLGIAARIRLFQDALAAVAHAHANLIVHRDIKPSNVLVAADGQVKLLDFGIAKLLEAEGDEAEGLALTREGETALTPEYAAPEQLTGGHVTTATDLYALGVLLYLLLVGRHPAGPRSSSPAELVHAIVDREPARASDAAAGDEDAEGRAARRVTTPRRLRAALRGDLDNIVAQALKKSPSQRYPSVEALAEDLRRYQEHRPVTARGDSLAYRAGKFVRRNRTTVAMAILAFLASVAGLLGTASQARRATAHAARADHAARLANEQRDFALRQLSRAEAINDLNSFLLYDAAPLGKPFTVGELLSRAEQIVERQRDESVENRVALLVAIGRQYHVQDEHDKAQRVLTEAYALSRDSPDPSTRASAGCGFAGTLATGGRTDRAEQLVQESLTELPLQPQFALHRCFCLLSGSAVARQLGNGPVAVERAEAARRLLRESGAASGLLSLRVAMDRAESYRTAGRMREAAAAFEEAFGRMTALGRGETETAGTLLNNWALVLTSQGQPLQAEGLYRRAIAISRADGTEDRVSPMLLTNIGRSLAALDRLSEAADYTERAYAKAERSGNDAAVVFALFARAFVYRRQGDLQRAADMLSQVEPRMRRRWPAGNVAYAVITSERAEIARARGDLEASLSGAERAVSLATASTDPWFLPRALQRRSELLFQMGQAERAVDDARSALRLELQKVGPGVVSNNIGLILLALGRALRAQNKHSEAREAFASAVQHLDPSVGERHADARTARELLRSTPVDRAR